MLAFGPKSIPRSTVFLLTPLTYAVVNIKPVFPGHVLVVPRRLAPRLSDLTAPEVTDLFLAVQRVGAELERAHGATSLTIAIQDGPDAGQTIPHVHVHIIPRHRRDLANNDEIYDRLDKADSFPIRELKDMEEEARGLRLLFPNDNKDLAS
jgi:bis(5'-adenosyl)-triphosphatase